MNKFQVTWTLLDHDVTISVGNNLTHADVGKYEIDKPQIGKYDLCLVLSTVLVKVTTANSETYARMLFSQKFAYAKFRENKTLTKW